MWIKVKDSESTVVECSEKKSNSQKRTCFYFPRRLELDSNVVGSSGDNFNTSMKTLSLFTATCWKVVDNQRHCVLLPDQLHDLFDHGAIFSVDEQKQEDSYDYCLHAIQISI